ncbi:MAG: hypothetical protein WKG00_34770 [Polyangiaceae bacterium]
MHARYAPVEVKVSYGARVGCSLAIGIPLVVAFLALLSVHYLGDWFRDPNTGPPCTLMMTGAFRCSDKTSGSSTLYLWTVKQAGTYSVTVMSPGKGAPGRTLAVAKAESTAETRSGSSGQPVTHTVQMSPGSHTISVSDTVPRPGGAPFTLVVTRQGGGGQAEDEKPFPVPVVAVLALGLVFLYIPTLLLTEKKRIPASIGPGGVTMRNGAVLPWTEYQGCVVLHQRTRGGQQIEIGVRLLFARGMALIRYRPITNLAELGWIIESLKQRRNPWGAP